MAIAYVGRIGSAVNATGGTSAVITVGAGGVALGDTIIVVVGTGASVVAPSAADTQGNSYHLDKGPINDGGGDGISVLSANASTALVNGNTITVTMGSNAEYFVMAEEFSGASTTIDTSNSAAGTTGSATASVTTGNANDLIIAAALYASRTIAPPAVWSGGATGITPDVSVGSAPNLDGATDSYDIVSATGTYGPSAAVSAANWSIVVVAYKAASAAAAGPLPRFDPIPFMAPQGGIL